MRLFGRLHCDKKGTAVPTDVVQGIEVASYGGNGLELISHGRDNCKEYLACCR